MVITTRIALNETNLPVTNFNPTQASLFLDLAMPQLTDSIVWEVSTPNISLIDKTNFYILSLRLQLSADVAYFTFRINSDVISKRIDSDYMFNIPYSASCAFWFTITAGALQITYKPNNRNDWTTKRITVNSIVVPTYTSFSGEMSAFITSDSTTLYKPFTVNNFTIYVS